MSEIGWTLTSWLGPDGNHVVWIAEMPGVPDRCICGAPFAYDTPPDAVQLVCQGDWRHEWRSLRVELEERIAVKTGQLGGSISDLKPGASTDEKPKKGR